MRYTDSFGDSCEWYDSYPSDCGGFDTADFDSMNQCCACGGAGCPDGEDCSRIVEEEDDTITWENCINNDNTTDAYGDTCTSWYDSNPIGCGYYDDDDFVASE